MNKNWIIAILFFPLISCGKQSKEIQDENKPFILTDSLRKVITIDTVKETEIKNELLLNGRVTFNPERVANIYPIFGGTLMEVKAEIGDFVKKGDILAVIRSSEVADYEKQQKETDQQVVLSNRNLDATKDMFHSGMASERDVLQAEQEATQALTEQKRLKEIFSIYNISNNSVYEIKSPVSGFVVDKRVSKEMQIRSDQSEALYTISGLENVWVMADVYESDISKVKQGAKVHITTLAYENKKFGGSIDKVYNMLDSESKTMSVRVELKNENYMLKPGMFTNVYVQCKVDGRTMPRINAHAVIFEDGKQYVVRISKEGLLEKQEISVYKQTDNYCYIQSGLKEDEMIVNTNALLVYNALK